MLENHFEAKKSYFTPGTHSYWRPLKLKYENIPIHRICTREAGRVRMIVAGMARLYLHQRQRRDRLWRSKYRTQSSPIFNLQWLWDFKIENGKKIFDGSVERTKMPWEAIPLIAFHIVRQCLRNLTSIKVLFGLQFLGLFLSKCKI